jgi:hypothetical protein
VTTTLISRDPFARCELHRRAFTDHHGAQCQWCGSLGRPLKHGGHRLYWFETHHDAGRMSRHGGVFCSKSCHDSYHT